MDSPSDFVTPDEITSVVFESRLRGFAPAAVEAHLQVVADTVRSLLTDNEALRADVAGLRAELAQTAPAGELDDDKLRARLGDDVVRAASDARKEAAEVVAAAQADALRILSDAESVFAERSEAADVEAGRRHRIAQDALDEERQFADAEATRLVTEAQVVRRQILEDLARRRSLARRQIEQLRAGRERLISSHDTLRRSLDELSAELSLSMSEARAAAETAGHSVPETSIEELEAEIETARLSGLLDTGPVPVVSVSPDPDEAHKKNDPVAADPTVADLFARMRSSQESAANSARGAGPKNHPKRTKDSVPQR